MDLLHRLLVFVIGLVLVKHHQVAAGDEPSISMDITQMVASPGTNITLTCIAEKMGDHVVALAKQVHIPGDPYPFMQQISNNDVLLAPYNSGGRFTIRLHKLFGTDSYIFFEIFDVHVEDTANYSCAALNTEVQADISFEVEDAPDYVGFELDGTGETAIQLVENQLGHMTCNIRGMVPRPKVNVTIGGHHLSRRFIEEEAFIRNQCEALRGDPNTPCRLHFTYDIDVHVTYTPTDADDGQWVQCTAALPSGTSVQPVSTLAPLSVAYSPKFICVDGGRQSTRRGERNYVISCIIRYNPALNKDARITVDGVTMNTGHQDHQFRLSEKILTDNSRAVTLTIPTVMSQHFTNYTFTASNMIGSNSSVVSLVEESYHIPPSSRSPPLRSLALLIVTLSSLLMTSTCIV